jgi:hypothetical protein
LVTPNFIGGYSPLLPSGDERTAEEVAKFLPSGDERTSEEVANFTAHPNSYSLITLTTFLLKGLEVTECKASQ